MFENEDGKYPGKYFLTVIVASILLASFGTLTHNAFAMGQNGCINEYDGPFVSFTINNGSQTFDPLASPGVTFNSYGNFNVTFVIHTPSINSWNNSNTGAVWYDEDVFGYVNGHCVGGVGPNQNVTVSQTVSNQSPYGGYMQSIIFGTRAYSSTVFHVQWISSPSIPQSLQAISGNAQISLSWSAPVDNGGSSVTNYKIYRSTNSGAETLFATVGNVKSYNDTTVINGQTYFYKVTAVNSVGESSPSNEASATLVAVPQSPTGLTATPKMPPQVNLSWTVPSDNGGSKIMGYMIERSTDNGSTWSSIVQNTNDPKTTYTDSHLMPVKTYTYRVSAINGIGTSDPSNTASARPLSAHELS